ncbi:MULTISPECIES: DUF998 domain-containing protein [unclassified Streptosporangium]|uniref:DUF998 domain-containing protein n=1 Tax=unclassified Streptosporangium TaxID=2632669 RepID=UPI002E28BE8A|nr:MULTISPECIES: DUF998 domain-containing protein [unclassified Streptosporangium]
MSAYGGWRASRPGPSGTWGPLLVGLLGAGLIVDGVFVTDAGAGFPPGAPAGAPEISRHGALHGLGPMPTVGGMTVGCPVFARRFAALRRWGWVAVCVAAAVAAVLLTAWSDPEGPAYDWCSRRRSCSRSWRLWRPA